MRLVCYAINTELLLTFETSFWTIVELLLKERIKEIRVNDVTDSKGKHNIESESQRGVVINKSIRKSKNG